MLQEFRAPVFYLLPDCIARRAVPVYIPVPDAVVPLFLLNASLFSPLCLSIDDWHYISETFFQNIGLAIYTSKFSPTRTTRAGNPYCQYLPIAGQLG